MGIKFKTFIILLAFSSCNGHIPILGDLISSTSSKLHDVAGGIFEVIAHGLNPKNEEKPKQDETIVIIVNNESSLPEDYRPHHGVNDRDHHRPGPPYHNENGNFHNNGNYNYGPPHNNYDYNQYQGNIPNKYPNKPNYPNHEFQPGPPCHPNKFGFINQNCGHNYGRPPYPQQNGQNGYYNPNNQNGGHHHGRPLNPQQNGYYDPHGQNGANNNHDRPHYPHQHENNGYNNNNDYGRPLYPPQQTGSNEHFDPNGYNNNAVPNRPNAFDNNDQEIYDKKPDNFNSNFNDNSTPEYSTKEPVPNVNQDNATKKPNDVPLFIPLFPDNNSDDKNAPKRDTEKDSKPVDDKEEDFEIDIRFKDS